MSEFRKHRHNLSDMPSRKPGDRYIDGIKRLHYADVSREAQFVWTPEGKSELGKCLLVVAGPNLSGKTTLAEKLALVVDTPILDIDANWRNEWRTVENRGRMSVDIYQSNHVRALDILKEKKPALLVAAYSWPTYHNEVIKFAEEQGCQLKVFQLSTPDENEARKRLALRLEDPNNISDMVDIDKIIGGYKTYRGFEESYSNHPNVKVVHLDSHMKPEENLEIALASLRDSGNN